MSIGAKGHGEKRTTNSVNEFLEVQDFVQTGNKKELNQSLQIKMAGSILSTFRSEARFPCSKI